MQRKPGAAPLTQSRIIAFDILLKCEKSMSYANLQLDAALEKSKMEERDKRLTAQLVYGTLEWQIYLDYVISIFCNREFLTLSPTVKIAIRLGAYQLLKLDRIPPNAACSQSVDLVKLRGEKSAETFVNAILRAISRTEGKINLPDEIKHYEKHLSVKYSCPMWIVEMWKGQYGASVKRILEQSVPDPNVTLRVNTLKITTQELLKHLQISCEAEMSVISDDMIVLKNAGNIRNVSGFDEGLFFVQDLASRLCAKTVGAKSDELIYDMCAAPGGKTFSMAIDMQNKGLIKAFDLHENRVKLIESGAKRLKLSNINANTSDASKTEQAMVNTADAVLCDVPCSGMGILGKKPDIKLKSMEDIEKLPSVQFKILENSSKYIKSGGRLIYSTCTLNKRENEEVVQRFMGGEAGKEFKPLKIDIHEDLETIIGAEGSMITILPKAGRNDGFFIASMMKK